MVKGNLLPGENGKVKCEKYGALRAIVISRCINVALTKTGRHLIFLPKTSQY